MADFMLGSIPVNLEMQPDCVRLTHTRKSAYKRQWLIFSLPFLFFLLFMLIYGITLIATDQLTYKMGFAMSMAGVMLLLLSYYNLMLFYSIRHVYFEKRVVYAQQGPLLWFGNFRLSFQQLDGFYVIERFPARRLNGSKEDLGFVGLYALAKNGRRLTIVEGDKEDIETQRMVDLYNTIKTHLGYSFRLKYLKEHPNE